MISTQALADFCRRGATSLRAGLDVRQVLAREATIGPSAQRRHMEDVSRRVNDGEPLADAIKQQRYFPPLAVEMINVGERTGQLERVLRQLAEHYAHLLSLRRVFLTGLMWPAIQLLLTLAVVGFLIWIMGFIAEMRGGGEPIDLLGIGLVGTSGLLTYLAIVGAVIAAIAGIVFAIARGFIRLGPLMHLIIRIPVLGRCLQYLALSRIAWALSMAIDAGMDAITSLRLALRAAQNVYYTSAWPAVERAMEKRMPMADALRASGHFPEEFLMVLETGELSGMVSETLDHHAADLRERAESLLKRLTVLAGTACSLFVMLLVGLVILRIGMFYIGTIQDALDMTM